MVQPVVRFKVGSCVASVFGNEVLTADGNRVIRSVALQKIYKDKEGTFRPANSLNTNDIPKAILALLKAYNYLVASDATADVAGERE